MVIMVTIVDGDRDDGDGVGGHGVEMDSEWLLPKTMKMLLGDSEDCDSEWNGRTVW